MDEKQVAELRKFIVSVTNPNISNFIDLKKLYNSEIFNLAVQMGIEHAIKHEDFIYINRFLALFEGTIHINHFISSLRPKLTFALTETKPCQIKKASPKQISEAEKQAIDKLTYVNTALSKPVKKKTGKRKVSYDIMDSRLLISGSYGHGKRR